MNIASLITSLMLLSASAGLAAAQDIAPNGQTQSVKRIVKPVPMQAASVKNIYRVSSAKTPSGFPVPRYVSLKVGKVNGSRRD